MSGSGKAVRTVKAMGNALIDGVLDGTGWKGAITYAFPTEQSDYSYSGEPDNGVTGVSDAQKDEALFALEVRFGGKADDGFSIEGFTKTKFSPGSAETATIRFAETGNAAFDRAYADFPGTDPQDGDIWFGPALGGTPNDFRTPVAGNYAWHTLMHELGHALGLKHGHDGFSGVALPAQFDSPEYSIMTYRGFVGQEEPGLRYEFFGGPQTFMMSDIAALQQMYGADFTTNGGATVYAWTPDSGETLVNGEVAIAPGDNRIFATVWDGGGKDTYDLSAYANDLKIDLRPGMASTFSGAQLANLGGGPNNGFASGNIYNALLYRNDLRSLIENARGGSGDDSITGNAAANGLHGDGGRDRLTGGANGDDLWGGSGRDRFIFRNLSDSKASGSGRDTIFDFTKDDRIDLRSIDADTQQEGKQAFDWIGTKKFTGDEGDLRYVKKSSDTFIYGDANGDRKADFAIHLDDAVTLKEVYFLL